MFSVPLREIPRTISFRTALLFLVLFGCSFLALFGYIYWQTSFYLTRQTNASLHRIADNRGRQTPEVREREIRLRALQDVDGKLPHTLYDPEGKFILLFYHPPPEGKEVRFEIPLNPPVKTVFEIKPRLNAWRAEALQEYKVVS